MSQDLDNNAGGSFAVFSGQAPKIDSQHASYQQVARAIGYLVEHQHGQPSLADLAAAVGLSEFHLQRSFSRWAGVSPKQFLQFLTKEHAKQLLQDNSVLESSLASGLSGSSRLHDLLVKWEGVTPGEIRKAGKGLEIHYGIHSTPFGYCLLAQSQRGICKLAFFDEEPQMLTLIDELNADWARAEIIEDHTAGVEVCAQIFAPFDQARDTSSVTTIHLLLQGSPFKLQVWEALLRVPPSSVCAYQHIAEAMNRPSAARAVASAIANNRIAYLIPCHRVIRSTGALSEYRWGQTRKAAIIAREQCIRH